MRQKIVCAEGNSAEEAESLLNEKLFKLGPNYEVLSAQGSGVTVHGQPGILFVALVQLTAENNIAYWPLNKLDLASEEFKRLTELLGPTIKNVRDLTLACGIRTKISEDESLLRAVTSALGKHGLCLQEH